MAQLYGLVATYGRMPPLTLIRERASAELRPDLGLKQKDLDVLREGLKAVVNDIGGTAHSTVYLPDIRIAGKTGTAQVGSIPGQNRSPTRGSPGMPPPIIPASPSRSSSNTAVTAARRPVPSPAKSSASASKPGTWETGRSPGAAGHKPRGFRLAAELRRTAGRPAGPPKIVG